MNAITTVDAEREQQLQTDSRPELIAARRERWNVVGAVTIVSFLTILARAEISGTKAQMAHDLKINDVTFGLVFGAFALGYAIFMVPCGFLADRWGPRKSLTLSVFLWSLFTVCTGLASGIVALIVIRFLFGLAEAGIFPQATRALHNWTLLRHRGWALGLLNMGSRLGAGFALAFTPISVERFGWRQSFFLLGIVGMIWAAIWYWWFRDNPSDKPVAFKRNISSDAGRNASVATSNRMLWRKLLSSRNFYLLTYQYFASQFTFFICLSWLLPFATTHYGITGSRAGMYSSIPLYCGALAMWSGGTIVDRIYKTGRWRLSRVLPPIVGLALATVAMLPAPFMHSAGWFIACFALTTFGLDLTVSASWTTCCDVGRRYSGTLSAAMNTAGALGSLASSLVFPILTGWAGGITLYCCVAAVLNVIALTCWSYIEPARPIVVEE